MRKIFNIETSSEAEWDAILKIIRESFLNKYFTGFEISVPYKIYNSNAFNEWLEKLMRECRVNNSCMAYRFWRFDEHIMASDASYHKIIFRKAYAIDKEGNENLSKHCKNLENELTNAKYELSICQEQRNNYANHVEKLEEVNKHYENAVIPELKKQIEELQERNKRLMADNVLLKTLHDEHCENQKKEINLLLKQKDKLEKKLEACKNHQIDMMAYRDEVIGKISREKNELENANTAQTRYIEEFEENMKKGNEQYNKLNERYKRLKDAYDDLKFNKFSSDEKYRKLEENWSEKYNDLQNSIDLKNRRIASLEQDTKTKGDVIKQKNSEICYLKSEIEKIKILNENVKHLERENECLRELYSCAVESSKKIIDQLRKEKE